MEENKTGWGKLTSQFFLRGKIDWLDFPCGKNGPAHSFPRENTDCGKMTVTTGQHTSIGLILFASASFMV